MEMEEEDVTPGGKNLIPTPGHMEALAKQGTRLVPVFKVDKFKKEAKKHWDLFYKRNENRFFKDRHWTTREFEELTRLDDQRDVGEQKVLLEIGCGAGNFVFPLLEEERVNFFIYACDFSSKAVDLVRSNLLYDETKIVTFQADLTDLTSFTSVIPPSSVDIISLVFVLSAVDPNLFAVAFQNVSQLLKPRGLVVLRDYGLNDMAMFRFKPGTKVADQHYIRHDGTMTYFFTTDEIARLASQAGLMVDVNEYIHRRTINVKEDVDVARIFVQCKLRKMSANPS